MIDQWMQVITDFYGLKPEAIWTALGLSFLVLLLLLILSIKNRKQIAPEAEETASPKAPSTINVPDSTPEPAPQSKPIEPPGANDFKAQVTLKTRLKSGLSKTRDLLSLDLERILASPRQLDDALKEELEELLITADVGVRPAIQLIENISRDAAAFTNATTLKSALREEIRSILKQAIPTDCNPTVKPRVTMVIGVNGVGKTTTIGKMAAKSNATGRKVLIAAADTFRAAAGEQLSIWAKRANAEIVMHRENSDPAAVAYDGIDAALARDVDDVFVDTAGRLHTKVNLIEELKKIKRTINKRLPGAPHEILLVLDATTGQNALMQTKLFHREMDITGIVLTKLDGSAKGGIVVSIVNELKLPLKYIGVGENIDDLQHFDPDDFCDVLF